jgi:hypothetical protein
MNRKKIISTDFVIIGFPLLLLIFTNLYAQVNIETLRKIEMENGWYGDLKASLGYQAGNSEYLLYRAGIRIDFLHNKYYSFLIFNYKRGSESKRLFVNTAFVHLRSTYAFTDNKNLLLEMFAQNEFNDFIKLKNRYLFGSGLRIRLLKSEIFPTDKSKLYMFLGIGGMWEHEELEDTRMILTEIFRSTNYVSFYWIVDERLTFNLINYYQRSLNDVSDYRILLESNLGFYITRKVAFTVTLNYRYDSLPPTDVKNYDLEIINGINISF